MRDQSSADGERLQPKDFALVDQRQLRSAAADVDVQHTRIALFRQCDGAGTMRSQQAFELVASGGAHELASFGCKDFVNRAGVGFLDRLAGENHRAAVDVRLLDASFFIGAGDELAQTCRVNRTVGQEGREHDRRAPDDAALNHDEAARQALRLALQDYAGEQKMRRGRPDVDADRGQLDVLLIPDRLGDGGARFFRQF